MKTKAIAVRQLFESLDMHELGWQIVDHWEGDLTAIGVASRKEPRRLVYISVFDKADGLYDFECEEPSGPELDSYLTVNSGENVTSQELLKAMGHHLNK